VIAPSERRIKWDARQQAKGKNRCGTLMGGAFVDGVGAADFAWVEDGGWEIGVIGGIGEVLDFEAEVGAKGIGAAFAMAFAVEMIAGVKLDAGFGGEDLEGAAGFGIVSARGERGARRSGFTEDVGVVVAERDFQLLVVSVNARADRVGFEEIEGSSRNGLELAGGNLGRVGGKKIVGDERDFVIENVA